jgi:hypothetical protein
MVIVVMTDGREQMAAALGGELGWPVVDAAPRALDGLRQLAEAALDRRASLIIRAGTLSRAERAFVARNLMSIRFVSPGPLDESPGPPGRQSEEPVIVMPARDPHDNVRALRLELGI